MTQPTQGPGSAEPIAGAILEVKDLGATRAFYDLLFQEAGGRWKQRRTSAVYEAGRQTIEFVRRARPKTSDATAQHHAFRVGANRMGEVVNALIRAGHGVNWWHEDHPSEQELSPYVEDPSGNCVQLVASEPDGALLDHIGLEFADLEYAEDFYVTGLGGSVDSYHGWGDEPGVDVGAWIEGDDPCAPWTRYTRFSFRSRTVEPHATPQLFVGFGDTRLGLFLARAHHQESPEEVLRGTPRVLLRSSKNVSLHAQYLAEPARAAISSRYSGRTISFEVEGTTIFFRDPGGNYVQLGCNGS